MMLRRILPLCAYAAVVAAAAYNTFDGEGFPACREVAKVHDPTTVEEVVSIVKNAAESGTPIRASGKGHMWYDTMCSDNPKTEIIRTEGLTKIWDFNLEEGYVWIEAGVTFLQLAEYLHERQASVGYALVNWNITIAGAITTGSHRSSLSTDSMVASGALAMDIVDGSGTIRSLTKDDSDDWAAATTSLGLLGVLARVKFAIYPDQKLYADQKILEEADVLNGDIDGLIRPYVTANLWWWPYNRKFHHRYYDPVPNDTPGTALQSTFAVTELEASLAKTMLDGGKFWQPLNHFAETIFFVLWGAPNFREKSTDTPLYTWPVYGWNYDILIGGLYKGMKAEWDYGLRATTFEMAFPVTMANKVLKRVRELFDKEAERGNDYVMTSTYRSGINIKFGAPFENLLGQVHTADKEVDWSKGAIMFDFPVYRPSVPDFKPYNPDFYERLRATLIEEFPCRPHWSKSTREVIEASKKNLNKDNLARFKAVREKFDPNGMFVNVVGEIIGVA